MLLQDILSDRATRTPERVAIIAGRSRLTYGALGAMSDSFAAELGERAIRRGDRMAIFTDNWGESVVALLGALKAGAIACPLHPLTSADGLAGLLSAWRARALVTEARLATAAASAIRKAESVRLVILAGTHDRDATAAGCIRFEEAVACRAAAPPASSGNDTEIACVLAEGNPGAPANAALIRHRDVIAMMDGERRAARDEDAVITSLRLTSAAGLVQLFAAFRRGVTLMHSTSGAADARPMKITGAAQRPLRSAH